MTEIYRHRQRTSGVFEKPVESEWKGPKRAARRALLEAWEECSAPDWDGYGAASADLRSASVAARIVDLLLPTLGVPDFSFDPQGDALLEWYKAPDRVVDLSVGSSGGIGYAAIICGARMTGTGAFSEVLPADLAEVARRWVGSGEQV